MKNEIWKPVKEYEGHYEVSNRGRVRSLKNCNQYGLRKRDKPKILNLGKSTDGYLQAGLSKNCKGKTKKVHRLVAKAFMLNPENKPEVNHKDGVKTNNNVENLEWCTSKENIMHSDKLGLTHGEKFRIIASRSNSGEGNGGACLTMDQIKTIKYEYKNSNSPQREIADYFGVSQSQISRIVNNRCWRHI